MIGTSGITPFFRHLGNPKTPQIAKKKAPPDLSKNVFVEKNHPVLSGFPGCNPF